MKANAKLDETAMVDAAVAWLGDRLPPNWSVERSNRTIAGDPSQPQRFDVTITMRASNGTFITFAVEVKRLFAPRDVERMLPRVTRVVRALAGDIPILVVATWLSARTQELLAAERVNFIDLTGNARISLDNPPLFISSIGASRNPEPTERGRARVRGPKAARLVRLLVDVRPPYGVRDLAAAAKLTPGYVSRLLDALDHEALIERSRRGRVEAVDVRGVLRRWTESYDVLRTNKAETFVAARGAVETLTRLGDLPGSDRTAVTGSFAAVRFAPVAAPALLLAYCEDTGVIAKALDLLPAEEGVNIALLRPFDPVVWDRTTEDRGVRYVAVSQAAVDCLTGTGRMPAEGEALLTWLAANESGWRQNSLDDTTNTGNGK